MDVPHSQTRGHSNKVERIRGCSQVGETWAAMIVADEALPPGSGELKGTAFFGETREAAERQAVAYLGMNEAIN